jgi:hypothetical protein
MNAVTESAAYLYSLTEHRAEPRAGFTLCGKPASVWPIGQRARRRCRVCARLATDLELTHEQR